VRWLRHAGYGQPGGCPLVLRRLPQAGIAEGVVRTGPHTDKRYRTARWRNVRLRALNRDGWRCYAPSCMLVGNVADHITPVAAWTTDAEFFDVDGLRASCKRHNTARGVAARLEREVSGESEPVRPNRLVTPLRRAPRLY
jgi:hypothetical protein